MKSNLEFIKVDKPIVKAYPLSVGDVLFIKPNEYLWSVGDIVSNPTFIEDMWWDGSSMKFQVPEGMQLKVISIKTIEHKWWEFWKHKDILGYTLEIIKLP